MSRRGLGRALAFVVTAVAFACPNGHADAPAVAVFTRDEFAPPIEPAQALVLAGAIEYLGPAERVRVTGPIRILRNDRDVAPVRGVITLRAHDRIASTDVAGEFAITPLRARDASGGTLRGTTLVFGFVREGSRVSSVCGYLPGLDSLDDVASRVRVDRLPLDGDATLVVRRPDGTARSAMPLPNGWSTELQVLGDARVRPDETSAIPLVARLGDTIEVALAVNGVALARVSVGGERCARRSVRVAIHVVSAAPAALSPAGPTRASIDSNLRAMIDDTERVFGSCGIAIDPGASLFTVHAPPATSRLAVAEGDGLPARGGGVITFRVDGRRVELGTVADDPPIETATRIAGAVRDAGFVATLVPLPRIDPSAFPSADVVVRRRNGEFAELDPMPGSALSTDARQRIDLGRVDFADGLDASDSDHARAGTLEERSLLGALLDADPTTIDVVIIESFDDATRTGQAFVPRDGGPLGGSVVLDRRAVEYHASLLTLAHEIAHLLLDDPFHPPTSAIGRFGRVMAASSSVDHDVARTFAREECARMRSVGARFLVER